ncbi:MAG: YciI family protein [Solirubrobacteraceae bacterium]
MKYLMLVCRDPSIELTPEQRATIGPETEAWVTEMDRRGVRVQGQELAGVQDATTIRVRGGEVVIADGPFAETNELIAGFDLLQCADLDEAIEVAATHPVARFGSLELRPFAEG